MLSNRLKNFQLVADAMRKTGMSHNVQILFRYSFPYVYLSAIAAYSLYSHERKAKQDTKSSIQ